MPIYLGHPNSGQLTVASSLSSRGIDLLRAAPSAVNIYSRPTTIQIAYGTYVNHLPAYIKAYVTRNRESIHQPGYAITLPVANCIPLSLPPLVIHYTAPISSETTTTLSGVGFDQITIRNKQTAMIFPSYTFEQLRTIRGTKPVTTTFAPSNSLNIDAIVQHIVAVRIISGFLLAHTYPATADDSPVPPYKASHHFDYEAQGGKRKRDDNDVGGSDRTLSVTVGVDIGNASVRSSPEPSTPIVHLYFAKPPRNNPGWGTADQIPNASGLVFPYVPDLTTYDNVTVPRFLERYLLLCFGNSPETAMLNFEKFKAAWGLIYKTDVGNVLSHICRVAEIALQCQCRVFPLFSGNVYNGSVLSGGNFVLLMHSRITKPLSYADIQSDLATLHMHDTVLTAIDTMVNAGGHVARCTSMRQLSVILLGLDLAEDVRDDVKREVIYLNFPQKFWAINGTTVCKALTMIRNIGTIIPEDVPLHHSCLFNRERVATVLAAFGYQAPTFLIPNTPKVTLGRASQMPKTLVVRAVALGAAIADMHTVLSSKVITNNPVNLSKASQDRLFSGGDKTKVWDMLKDLVNSAQEDIVGKVENTGADKSAEVAEDDVDIEDF